MARGAKAIRKDAVKMVEAPVQLGGADIKESEEMQTEGVERGLLAVQRSVWRREYFRSDPPPNAPSAL